MYRKSMREALREAREYRDPVKEDRGFSSQQIKMAYGVLNDPRYKGGNYSGAYKAIERIAKGLASHPDVANALKRANEETVTEFKKMTVSFKSQDDMAKASTDLAKQGFTISGNKDALKVDGKGADLNKYATDMKNFYGATVKAESLEEANMKRILGALQDKLSKEGGAAGFDDLKKTAKSMGLDLTPAMLKDMPGIKQHRDGDYILETFTLKKYKENERENDHSLNAIMLVKQFGTDKELKDVEDIDKRHKKAGSISQSDLAKRNQISNKYYKRLK